MLGEIDLAHAAATDDVTDPIIADGLARVPPLAGPEHAIELAAGLDEESVAQADLLVRAANALDGCLRRPPARAGERERREKDDLHHHDEAEAPRNRQLGDLHRPERWKDARGNEDRERKVIGCADSVGCMRCDLALAQAEEVYADGQDDHGRGEDAEVNEG